jgi:hypothetical protein
MYLYFKCNVKGGTQNTIFEFINQHKNDTCHVQSLEKDFYFGTLGSFDYVFTPKPFFYNQIINFIIILQYFKLFYNALVEMF